MSKRIDVLLVVALVIGAALYLLSPGVRAVVHSKIAEMRGWTPEARKADPDGFLDYVNRRLTEDAAAMQSTRRELTAEIGQLTRKQRELTALRDQARSLAGDFRTQYRTISAGTANSVVVRGGAYTGEQVVSQVRMLLAEAEGYDADLQRVAQAVGQAEQKLQELAVQINATETQLAMLETKRQLLRAQTLSHEGQQLFEQIDALLNGNSQVVQGNPVRTVRELLRDAPKPDVPDVRVTEFLSAKVEDMTAVETGKLEIPAEPVGTQTTRKASKPIFQQY